MEYVIFKRHIWISFWSKKSINLMKYTELDVYLHM
jgi:hypothetical protein